MRIATANIKNFPDMPERLVVEDALAVADVAQLFGQQENNPAEDLPAIIDALGPAWSAAHRATNVPIYWRKDTLVLLSTRKVAAPFEPVLPLTPRPRWIAGATFRLRDQPAVPPFAVVNVHLVAGGHNGPRIPARARQWAVEFSTVRTFVREYRAKGLTTFVLGDWNDPRPPEPYPEFRWLVGNRLDRIGVTNGPLDVDEVADGTLELNSDHNAQWTRVLLSKRLCS